MMKALSRFMLSVLFLAALAAACLYYYQRTTAEWRIKQLQDAVARLTTERRVAQMIVKDQTVLAGVKTTTLLFVETDRSGKELPPLTFNVRGDNVHLDAMVIKFDHDLVKEGDPLKGKSIALFTKIYGDAQAPESGAAIDPPNEIPAIYRAANPRVTEFETALWRNFWTLAYDESARQEQGVRALGGQGLWEPLRTDYLYTITLESNGGLNLSRDPIPSIYRHAITPPSPETRKAQ